jgi:hypothetical protein
VDILFPGPQPEKAVSRSNSAEAARVFMRWRDGGTVVEKSISISETELFDCVTVSNEGANNEGHNLLGGFRFGNRGRVVGHADGPLEG